MRRLAPLLAIAVAGAAVFLGGSQPADGATGVFSFKPDPAVPGTAVSLGPSWAIPADHLSAADCPNIGVFLSASLDVTSPADPRLIRLRGRLAPRTVEGKPFTFFTFEVPHVPPGVYIGYVVCGGHFEEALRPSPTLTVLQATPPSTATAGEPIGPDSRWLGEVGLAVAGLFLASILLVRRRLRTVHGRTDG